MSERLDSFKTTGNHKGFYLKDNRFEKDTAGKTHLTLTNGNKEVTVSAYGKDQALIEAFDRIDKFYSD